MVLEANGRNANGGVGGWHAVTVSDSASQLGAKQRRLVLGLTCLWPLASLLLFPIGRRVLALNVETSQLTGAGMISLMAQLFAQ